MSFANEVPTEMGKVVRFCAKFKKISLGYLSRTVIFLVSRMNGIVRERMQKLKNFSTAMNLFC